MVGTQVGDSMKVPIFAVPQYNPGIVFGMKDRAQVVLSGGVSLAFAILMLASLTQIAMNMDSGKDIEPSLGPEFVHVKEEFKGAVQYHYNSTNDSAEYSFNHVADMFVTMEYYYGVIMEFTIMNITGSPGNETVEYRISMLTAEQSLRQEGTIELHR
jgi:hypothetical protein